MAAAVSHGPDASIPPSELWERLSKAERPYELVDFPRKDKLTDEPLGKVALWVLTQGESIIAKAEATKYARAIIQEKFDQVETVEGYKQVYEDAYLTEMLWRCCRRPENVAVAMFPSAQKIRDKLTSDECGVLFKEYALVQVRLGPIVHTMSDVEREAWITRLKEGGSSALAFLSWEQQTDLLMHSVSLLRPSPTANGSAGTPPEEPTSSSETT